MAEDNTAVCCMCIKIDLAIKVLIAYSFLGILGAVLNILGTLGFLSGYGLGGIVLLVVVAIGNLASLFCIYKFFTVFWAHYKKGENHDDADR
jgi:hypothetical protein